MLTLFKRLVFCLALVTFIGIAQDAQAIRFGLNGGFYNEKVGVPCASSKEFGLRLGFYADKTANDIIYASAIRGINLCTIGGGCAQTQIAQMEPVGCSPVQVGCSPAPTCGCASTPAVHTVAAQPTPAAYSTGSTAPIQQFFAYPPGGGYQAQAAAPKTEVYLLVLPEQNRRPVQQYQPQYQAAPQYAPEYYSEPVEYSSAHAPVRGMW